MKKNGGFTLIELLVVVAIIAILAAIAIPQFTKYKKKAAIGAATDAMRKCIQELATEYSENSSVTSKTCYIEGSSATCPISLSENSGRFYISSNNCTFSVSGYQIKCDIDSNNIVHCQSL